MLLSIPAGTSSSSSSSSSGGVGVGNIMEGPARVQSDVDASIVAMTHHELKRLLKDDHTTGS